ncbi:DEAD/DEAH box helicase [Akkermansiaceae bacterium]|nr:DEAD/DEAH box helicase [Akkermansiaceae bacterium]
MSNISNQIAPGSRIRLRDEEWLIQRIDSTRDSASRVFEVVGISPLVEGRSARFIEEIEKDRGDGIEIIDPRLTEPIKETSPFYRDTRLMLESQLRSSCPNDSTIHIGHQGAMDLLPFQLDPTLQALSQPRQRILIADTVGLGKTIECGILLSELIKRGAARRILVVAVKSMLTQFQKELWSRFSLPLTRLDSASLQSVRRKIPTNHNPFHYYDRSIISIDTLKQDGEYRNHLESAYWDVIVIDEAHNVAERSSNSQRSRVAKLLANRSDSLILLSATPHDGSRESFASLMNMLNPTAIKDPQNYGPDDIDGLFIRRFKKDVKDQIAGNFPERVVHTPKTSASPEEESAYAHLFEMAFSSIDQKRSGAKILFRTLLEKALFSSPAACLSTIAERIKRLEKRDDEDSTTDISALRELANTITEITPEKFTKYQNLLSLLKPTGSSSIGWSPRDPSDRLVIFTERIDTLKFLQSHLPPALKLKEKQVAILHGSLSDLEQQEIVEGFGSADSPIRLLLASDVASEGINLHHQSHRLIHFDIPWSLLTFQQRNGRIDRYGQTHQPEIYYLLTESSHEKIRGDARQGGAFEEGIIPDACDAITNRNVGQVVASNEGVTPNADDTVRDRDARQTVAAIEGINPDAGDAIRDCDACQAATLTEGALPNAGDAITNRDARQAGAVKEGNSLDVGDTVWNYHVRQAGAVTEGFLSDTGDAIRNRDARQAGAVAEGIISDASDRVAFDSVRND